MEANVFSWIGFYEEFAKKLLEYKSKRTELIDKIRTIYERAGMSLPTLEKDNNITDIDPFTVFGLFNKGLTDGNRIKIAESIKAEFGVESSIPQDFNGIPVVNNMAATFYYFQGERDEDDIDNLWRIFESAIRLADANTEEDRQTFMTVYDIVRHQKGIRWNLTMGLYWIRPRAFISFDSRNRDFIKAHQKELTDELASLNDNTLPDAKTYLAMRDSLLAMFAKEDSAYKSFPEFSYSAWKETQQPSTDNPTLSSPQDDNISINSDDLHSDARFKQWFMPIIDALIKLNGSASRSDVHKQIIESCQISDEELEKKSESGTYIIRNDIDWARNYLNYEGFLDSNTPKGIWSLNDLGRKIIIDDNLAGKIVAKWIQIKTAQRKGFSVPSIDLSPYYKFRGITYTTEDFLREVYISQTQYDSLAALLKKKKNIILQGAPGVGKTFVAKRLAYSMMGIKDKERVMTVQFHQSYSYEDFIMGYRPTEKGFQVKTGAFYNFCKKAEIDNENDYFFIIDEINRGNLNKIFGELFMLLETDKRGEEVKLLYKDEMFSVPSNIYLIGTMNTADRSLAMLDYALRRRFSFFDMTPGFETEGFKKYQTNLGNAKFDRLISTVERLNMAIADDETLGEGFSIGHSYFCGLKPEETDDKTLSAIVEFEILPLLREYWFDEPSKINDWSDQLRSVLR